MEKWTDRMQHRGAQAWNGRDVAQAGTGNPTAINISPFDKIQVELIQ